MSTSEKEGEKKGGDSEANLFCHLSRGAVGIFVASGPWLSVGDDSFHSCPVRPIAYIQDGKILGTTR